MILANSRFTERQWPGVRSASSIPSENRLCWLSVHRQIEGLVCQIACQLPPSPIRIVDFIQESGEPRRNRTFNPQIKSLLLCQLS